MHLKLKVEEDKELRDYIKSLIKGQVISVAREEIKNIVKEVFTEKSKDILKINPTDVLKEQLTKQIHSELKLDGWRDSYIKTKCDAIILSEVKKQLGK
jgi:hypothetical protein